jgi:hypothetical protein
LPTLGGLRRLFFAMSVGFCLRIGIITFRQHKSKKKIDSRVVML